MTLAQLTGKGSFTFRLGGQRFRGAAVPLADYFAWTALQEEARTAQGVAEQAAWYVPLLADRLQPGKVPPLIDLAWVMDHLRLQHRSALDTALLEEVDPGEALNTEGRLLTLGRVKLLAASYTLSEYAAYLTLVEEQGVPLAGGERGLPMEVRLGEVARALRERYRGGLSDPALITADWVVEQLTLPALKAVERLLFTGRLPGEADPAPAEDDPSKKS